MSYRFIPDHVLVSPTPLAGWTLVCLCAAWCRTCDAYQAVMQLAANEWPDAGCYWVDIEDDAHLLGDLEIETFPTVLVADTQGHLRFAGVLQPHWGVLQRLGQQAPHLALVEGEAYKDAYSVLQGLQMV